MPLSLKLSIRLRRNIREEKKFLEEEIPRQKPEESDELKSLRETIKSMQKMLEFLSSKGDLKNKTEKRQPQFHRQRYNSQHRQFQQNRSQK